MRNTTPNAVSRRHGRHSQSGVALVTTLLLLLLLTGLSLTMVLTVSSDMLVTGYYSNSRGSFYAADSGLSVARQALKNSLAGTIPANFATSSGPMPTTADTTGTNAITGSYGSYTSVNSSGSWPEKFKITSLCVGSQTFTGCATPPPTCTVTGGSPPPAVPTCANPNPSHDAATNPPTAYNYVIPYTMTAIGQSQGTEAATVVDTGQITIVANTGLGKVTQSFAGWGMFIDQYAVCSGGDLVPGTITGPVFTNGGWTFSSAGPYTFTGKVGQVAAKAGFDNGGCTQSATAPANGINPTFQAGFFPGQAAVPLPTNTFNQEQAVLDGIGNSSSAPTNAALNASLKNAAGVAYPTTGAASGVYLPYSVNASTGAKTFTGGGIYVQGNATVTLSPSGTGTQVYTIVQSGVTTTVTINNAANTTTITTGSNTQTITGVPEQYSTSDASEGPATMLYVNGNITALTGPGQGQAAIQNGTALTVTAAGSVTVTGDILYKEEPVTLTASGSTPIDTLVPANNYGQVLGIFTATGNVNLANTQSNGNLEIDASIATISQGGSGGIVNTGNAINTLTIVGGRIQNTIQNINTTTRNVLFDQRFATGGFAPPWFPSTSVTPVGGGTESVTTTVKRTEWRNQTQFNQ
jgi:Tfp pilus assembly protein PilX